MIRVVGLDLSLSSTGVARVTVDDDGTVATHAEAIPSSAVSGNGVEPRLMRLHYLSHLIADSIGWSADLVLIEAPTYARNVSGSAHDRAGLWWLTVDRISTLEPMADIREVHASHLKIYATGKGTRVGKQAVIDAARATWGHLFEIPPGKGVDDIADAVTLAALGAHMLGHPLAPVADERARAVGKIKLRKD